MCSFWRVNLRKILLLVYKHKKIQQQVGTPQYTLAHIILKFTPHVAPSDFLPISKDLTFESFQTSQAVEVAIVNDGFAELTEQFSIVLTSQDENVLIQSERSTLRVVITDQTGEIAGPYCIWRVLYYDDNHSCRFCDWI